MSMRKKALATGVLWLVAASSPSWAAFHFMAIEQVIGGVNGNTSAQAIQLIMLSAGQNLLSGSVRMRVFDAAGANPVVITTFPMPNPASGGCRRILIASDDFENTTMPPVTSSARDYAMTALIPPGYLPAGSLTFENTTGTLVYWRVSWGGASYTGPTSGTFDNDNNGDFGKISGALPSTSTSSLIYTGPCAISPSTSNDLQYSVSAPGAVFRNNDNPEGMFTVVAEPIPAMGTWGLILTTLLLCVAGTIILRLKMRAA